MLNNKVWVILRPNYGIYGELHEIGICGSGFFINQNIFITCYHCINHSSFCPNGKYNNTDLILLSPNQNEHITESDVIKYDYDRDITYIRISGTNEYFETDYIIEEKDNVYNIGYPSLEIKSLIQPIPLKIIDQRVQYGFIKSIEENYSILSNDVKINKAKAFILNYCSSEGYSGGPLLRDDKVVGIMSHKSPKHRGSIVAIASSDFFKKLIEK